MPEITAGMILIAMDIGIIILMTYSICRLVLTKEFIEKIKLKGTYDQNNKD